MNWSDLLFAMALTIVFGAVTYANVSEVRSAQLARMIGLPYIAGSARVEPPPGFVGFCVRESWSCGGRVGHVRKSRKDLKVLAERINTSVNQLISPEADIAQYGVQEYWTIPTSGRGDCEDYALLKMRMLLERGVPGKRLLLAVVITRFGERHLVLVVRTPEADLVLDNIEPKLLDWRETTYRFVSIQDPANLSRWISVKPAGAPPVNGRGKAELVSAVR